MDIAVAKRFIYRQTAIENYPNKQAVWQRLAGLLQGWTRELALFALFAATVIIVRLRSAYDPGYDLQNLAQN